MLFKTLSSLWRVNQVIRIVEASSQGEGRDVILSRISSSISESWRRAKLGNYICNTFSKISDYEIGWGDVSELVSFWILFKCFISFLVDSEIVAWAMKIMQRQI